MHPESKAKGKAVLSDASREQANWAGQVQGKACVWEDSPLPKPCGRCLVLALLAEHPHALSLHELLCVFA
eukprot:1136537-Pelagomonas_calceolata.AAC.10